jgi:hypothetical protein
LARIGATLVFGISHPSFLGITTSPFSAQDRNRGKEELLFFQFTIAFPRDFRSISRTSRHFSAHGSLRPCLSFPSGTAGYIAYYAHTLSHFSTSQAFMAQAAFDSPTGKELWGRELHPNRLARQEQRAICCRLCIGWRAPQRNGRNSPPVPAALKSDRAAI